MDGSVDWLCLPRFDSGACFAALLGTEDNGSWRIAPLGDLKSTEWTYRGESLVLETTFRTSDGAVKVTDFMPPRGREPDLVRIVEGLSGRVRVGCNLTARFDYGSSEPWVRSIDDGVDMVAGPDALALHSPIEMEHEGCHVSAEFEVSEGDRVPFVMTWHHSFDDVPKPIDWEKALGETLKFWEEWAGRSTYEGSHRDLVVRSLLTLKALTYAPTGGMVASPTTSLPERIGGVRNWDYRYCWLRDATFSLYALYHGGYREEAVAWRDWLLRAIAGRPDQMQIMYGVLGERRLPELELPALAGYEGSAPVRIGNLASEQFQLDAYGQVMDALHTTRRQGLEDGDALWALQQNLMDSLENVWTEPDEGIWEVRGPRQHFTHSKVMAWVAADRAVQAVDRFGLEGPVDQWRRLRSAIREDVLANGFSAELGSFVQQYGSKELDASLLLIPLVGFLRADDPRVIGTVDAIQQDLMEDGFLHRYHCGDGGVDGLPGHEGAFLACTFWLADCLAVMGRDDEAREIFERLCGITNDVGLLSEQYDPAAKRMLGNFPQALSHVALVNTAQNLCPGMTGPAQDRPHD